MISDRAAGPPLLGQLVLAIAIFLLALWPRSTGLATFVTTDEIFWVGRSGSFAQALERGQWAATFQTGHPGVPTMWAGLLGMGRERAISFAGPRRDVSRRDVSRHPNFLGALAAARWAVGVATAASIALMALLAWRLFGAGAALLGGALLALDPFFLAHSRLLHVDALQSAFTSVSLLAAAVHWQGEPAQGRRHLLSGALVLSGVSCGLAALAKSPALFLVGFVPLLALASAWQCGTLMRRSTWAELAAWAALVGLTYALFWPAMWAAPGETLRGVFEFIRGNTSPEHSEGPWFYPLAFALRTTPLALIGLALLAANAVTALRRRARIAAPSSGRTCHRRSWAVLALSAYALLFGLAMTLTAKTFDRYLLPAFPIADLLAGVGLAGAAARLRWVGGAGYLLGGAFGLPLLVFPVAISAPYQLAWYNPLAGGGPAAAQTLAVGWGEGLDQVASFLNLKPDAARLKVAMSGEIYTAVLGAQFRGQVVPLDRDPARGQVSGDPGAVDYYLRYVRTERDGAPALYDPRFQTWVPELVVRLADIEHARLYPAAAGIPLGATFGTAATLEGYGIESLVPRPGRGLSVRLLWRGQEAGTRDHRVVVELRRPDGAVAATMRQALLLEPGQRRERTVAVPVPVETPPGEHLLWVGLEDAAGQAVELAGRPASLAPGAPERPGRAVLRSVLVR